MIAVESQQILESKSLLHKGRLELFCVNFALLFESVMEGLLCEGALAPLSPCCLIVSRTKKDQARSNISRFACWRCVGEGDSLTTSLYGRGQRKSSRGHKGFF